MTVELTAEEAQILIAVLTFAEGVALGENPGITAAMKVLRPWRSVLLLTYLREAENASLRPEP